MVLLIGEKMNYKDYSDGELIYLINEANEDAKEIIYEKYKYIIEIIIKKYIKTASSLGIDYNDLYQEALIGFMDAINNYKDNKDASLARFITVCVDRRLQVAVIKAGRQKNKLLNESLSLEHTYENIKVPLMYLIGDNNENDPLENISKAEELQELMTKIKEQLSNFENEVFSLMINNLNYNEIAVLLDRNSKQIDNTMQRIKTKVKKVLADR